ncbi:MAG TPA: VOC family protein [Tepidisphaeraceae bacterium]|jgi:predicted enzyme related to lactoylglutathione lyase
MNPDVPLLGLRSAIYPVLDLPAARAWYAELLGVAPYFDQPFYVGFNVGGFELGLVPDGGGTPGRDGVRAYWGVADARVAFDRILALGGRVEQPVTDVGGGIRVASAVDPFGNVLSIIQNPHFDAAAVR